MIIPWEQCANSGESRCFGRNIYLANHAVSSEIFSRNYYPTLAKSKMIAESKMARCPNQRWPNTSLTGVFSVFYSIWSQCLDKPWSIFFRSIYCLMYNTNYQYYAGMHEYLNLSLRLQMKVDAVEGLSAAGLFQRSSNLQRNVFHCQSFCLERTFGIYFD